MTPNELAAVRERYTGEKFPGLDIPMDQVDLSMKMSNCIIIKDNKYVKEDVNQYNESLPDDRHDDQQ